MTISIKPLAPALGAEISGFDIRDIDKAAKEEILQAWYRYLVLVVRGEKLSDDDLVQFGRRFGELEKPRVMSPLATRPEIMVVSNLRDDKGKNLGRLPDGEMSFHYDMVHQKKPNKAGILHAIEVPSAGGDTCFANMYLAYETLSGAMKQRLEGLTALNTYEYGSTNTAAKKLSEGAPTAVHPVIRTIPETGRKALYVSRLMTDRIVGLPEDESRALLDELCDHCEQARFIYQHKWKQGDLLVWDNRCTTHARTDFSAAERRLLKRVTVGDTVVPL
ncbi:MAG TPA: TauD/TfdA family dioxygenase [Acidiferrobacterales bacterium]|nr:TauD/TfdA family dioxygenase [Acidiferrobacterales bacterium]